MKRKVEGAGAGTSAAAGETEERRRRAVEDASREKKTRLDNEIQALEEEYAKAQEEERGRMVEMAQHLSNMKNDLDGRIEARARIDTEENEDRLEQLLPPELWEKIFDNLAEDALFPVASTCRYFREKQKVVMARNACKRMRTPFFTIGKLMKKHGEMRITPLLTNDYVKFCHKAFVKEQEEDERRRGSAASRTSEAGKKRMYVLTHLDRWVGGPAQWQGRKFMRWRY